MPQKDLYLSVIKVPCTICLVLLMFSSDCIQFEREEEAGTLNFIFTFQLMIKKKLAYNVTFHYLISYSGVIT